MFPAWECKTKKGAIQIAPFMNFGVTTPAVAGLITNKSIKYYQNQPVAELLRELFLHYAWQVPIVRKFFQLL